MNISIYLTKGSQKNIFFIGNSMFSEQTLPNAFILTNLPTYRLNDLGFTTPLWLCPAFREGFCPKPVKVDVCQDHHLLYLLCNNAVVLIPKIIGRKKLAVQGIAVNVQEQLLPQS